MDKTFLYKVTKFYNYNEVFIVKAKSAQEAEEIVNSKELDPDDTNEDFDFQTVELI